MTTASEDLLQTHAISTELDTIDAQMQARAKQFTALFHTSASLQAHYDALLERGADLALLRVARREKSKAMEALSVFETQSRQASQADERRLDELKEALLLIQLQQQERITL
jgi:hypothetical protein